MSDSITVCGKCGAAVADDMRFCPGCGKSLVNKGALLKSFGPRQYALLVSGALVLFGASYGIQNYVHWTRGEVKPTKELQVSKAPQQPATTEQSNDPELVALRQQLVERPGDLMAMKSLAAAIGVKLRNNPEAPPELVFEAIDLLGSILKAVPEDPDALVMMADVSFDQRAFTKALEFYERYLKVSPNDLGARSRYASTLTFVNRYEDSIAELKKVLETDPKNFPAMAYLAITWAQKGDLNKAREIGVTALEFAPSDEARARFSNFISSLDEAQAEAVPASGTAPSSQPQGGDVSKLVEFVQQNQIAGPKFASFKRTDGVLTLYFRNFPMQAMPPFVKDKFTGSLKAKALELKDSSLTTIVFADAETQEEMERVELKG